MFVVGIVGVVCQFMCLTIENAPVKSHVSFMHCKTCHFLYIDEDVCIPYALLAKEARATLSHIYRVTSEKVAKLWLHLRREGILARNPTTTCLQEIVLRA